eukprot:COSAG06_NODE_12944_length_1310_cov_1.023947_1_plen_36_part_10
MSVATRVHCACTLLACHALRALGSLLHRPTSLTHGN